jgi:hypothetical protein
MTTKTKPVLLWNERGQIGCTKSTHSPHRGSDTWVSERWRVITRNQADEFEREVGHPPSCETCSAIARSQTPES